MKSVVSGVRVFFYLALLTAALRADEAMDRMLDVARAHATYTSGLFSIAAKESGEAQVRFESVVRTQPEHARAWFHLGDLAFRRGDLAAAQKHYRRSLELEPEFVFAHFNLACVLSRGGDSAAALVEIEALLKLGYARWEKLQSDTDLAAARARPEFAALIEKYRAAPPTPSRVTAFHLADHAAKLAILEAATDAAGADFWQPLAAQAWFDGDAVVRKTAVQMHRYFDAMGSLEAFVRGLYDSQGRVSEAAADALANVGPSALIAVDAVLASGDAQAIAVARRIKTLIKRGPSVPPALAPSAAPSPPSTQPAPAAESAAPAEPAKP